MADIHYWWTVAMWVLGATVWTLAAMLAITWMLWKLVREIVGWPTIIKALRMYRKQGASNDR